MINSFKIEYFFKYNLIYWFKFNSNLGVLYVYTYLYIFYDLHTLNIFQKCIYIKMSSQKSSSEEIHEVKMSKAAQGIIII